MYNIAMRNKAKTVLDNFFSRYKKISVKKGEVLLSPNSVPDGVYYLTEGVVRRYSISMSGEDVTLNTYKPNSFFPVAWIINDTLDNHYWEAQTDCILWMAPKEEVLIFLQSNPEVVFDLLQRIYSGMDGMWSRLESLMSGSAYIRLIAEIIILAKRFGDIKERSVNVKVSEKDLATSSGLTRETVSRQLQVLKKKKLVLYKNKTLTILDINLLESEMQTT